MLKSALLSAALWFAGVVCLVATAPAYGQNRIAAPGWEGFATRDVDNKFDRCVLYNKSIQALTISPYDMLGITRSAKGDIGFLVFFEPSALKRGNNIPVTIRINGRPVAPLTGQALSDFHISIAGPVATNTVTALRDATSIDATAEGKNVHFDVSDVGAVLDSLDECVKSNAR